MNPTTKHSSAGFTLVELAVAATVLLIVLAGVAVAAGKASDAYEQARVRGRLVSVGYQALDRIASEFIEAEEGSMSVAGVGVGASTMTYRVADGAGGFSPDRTIRFEMVPGEFNDGVDNNGDGRIDEARIVWIEDEGGANERSVVLTNNVRSMFGNETANFIDDDGNGVTDEPGLVFQRDGEVVNIQFTLEQLDPSGRAISKSFQTSARARN